MVNSERIKLISECFIRPQCKVEAAKQPYYLGPTDLFMLSFDPIMKGLLFTFENNTTKSNLQSLIERLKWSLSIALVHFYPLAGQFDTHKYEEEHACLVFLDCNKGPGARLVHARYVHLRVFDILSSTDIHPAIRSFFNLGERMVNYDGHTKPLLSIQVTELLDGVFIGFTMNHSVADGTSFMHFILALSEIFNSEQSGESLVQISRVPIHKMYTPRGYGKLFKLPYLEPEEFIIRHNPDPFRDRIFHFQPESMKRLKAKANEECGGGQVIISSFMALVGLVWRSITKARNLPGHEKSKCIITVNARPRLDPPLSNNYFGNIVEGAIGECQVDELLGYNLGKAARLLSQEVKKTTNEVICELLKKISDCPVVAQPGLPGNCLVIGGSPRFDSYGAEFGFGPAVAVRTGYASSNKCDGKITANPGHEGEGSVDLEICLLPDTMNALEADEEFMSFVSG